MQAKKMGKAAIRTAFTGVVVASLVALSLVGAVPAQAAIVGSYAVSVGYDGTGQGTADACILASAPLDANAHDGVVCTNDTVSWLWSFNVPTSSTPTVTTLSSTLPKGVTWSSSDVTLCQSGISGVTGAGSITTNANGTQTLSCTLTFPAGLSFSGNIPMLATPTGTVANGTLLQPLLTASQVGEADVTAPAPSPVTVRSEPKVDLVKRMDNIGSTTQGGQMGFVILVSVYGFQLIAPNPKGIAVLANPITFTDDLAGMTAHTALNTSAPLSYSLCGGGAFAITPDVGNGVNAGTLSCSQAGGPGSPVSLTLTGADTSGIAPTGYRFSQPSGRVTVISRSYELFVPFSDVTGGSGGMDVSDQLKSFAPLSIDGSSNFGGTAEPGGATGDTCSSPASNNNCASLHLIVLSGGGVGASYKLIFDPTNCWGGGTASSVPFPTHCYYLPGESNGMLEGGAAAPGTKFYDALYTGSPTGVQTATNLIQCDKFNPAQQQVDTSTSTLVSRDAFGNVQAAANTFKVQYTNHVYSYDPATMYTDPNSWRNGGCGLASDNTIDGPWFDTVAAAGGAAAVSGVRVIDLTGTLADPDVFQSAIPMVNVDVTNGDHPVDWFSQRYDGSGGSAASGSVVAWRNGYVVVSHTVGVKKATVPAGVTTVGAGSSVGFVLTPTMVTTSASPGDNPETVTVVDTLPYCLVSPVASAATVAGWAVTVAPGDPGPDGLWCSSDDVSHTTVTYTSLAQYKAGDTIPTIGYSATVLISAPDNTQMTNTAVVSTPITALYESVDSRTAPLTLTLRGAAIVGISKAVDQPVVEITPDHVGWSVTWFNGTASVSTNMVWIDVLPFNGDGRGTSFSGTLDPVAVTALGSSTAGTVFEYTSRVSAQVVADPSDPSNGLGGATAWCTQAQFGNPGCPASFADVTAIRATTASFAAGAVGGMHIAAAPVGNVKGDVYVNDVGVGRSPSLTLPVPVSNQVQVRVVSSTLGDTVWWDYNKNGVQDPGEPGIPNVTVNILDSNGNVLESDVTNANGVYTSKAYHSGQYEAVVVASTLPGNAVAVYDLKHGLTGATGDSGVVSLGIDTARLDLDFGYLPKVSIGDHVWTDTNRNGIQDAGEPGLPGVTVNLYAADGTTLVATTVTDATGFYSFTSLVSGATYHVRVVAPAGMSFTPAGVGGNSAVDSNMDSSGDAVVVAPASGSNSATTPDDPTIDAGLVGMNLALAKTLNSAGPFRAGQTVSFTVTPSNTGVADALPGWSVTDLLPTGLSLMSASGAGYTCVGAVCTSSAALSAGGAGTPIIVSATVDAGFTGAANNVAYVSPVAGDVAETIPLGTPPVKDQNVTGTPTDNDAQAGLFVIAPAVSIVKYINGQDANTAPGVQVPYASTMQVTMVVTNTGDTVLTQVVVTDDKIATNQISCPKTALGVGESMTCTATYPAPDQGKTHTNTSTVVGTAPDGKTVTAADPANAYTPAQNPAIAITKYINGDDANTAPGVEVQPGSTMQIKLIVANTGDVVLDPVVVTDDKVAADQITCPMTVLAVGASMTCTATYPAPAAGARHTDTASVVGTAPDGVKVSASDPANAWVAAVSAGTLASTGAAVEPGLLAGALLVLAAGLTLLVVSRRRQKG